jgi:hypothetical protein
MLTIRAVISLMRCLICCGIGEGDLCRLVFIEFSIVICCGDSGAVTGCGLLLCGGVWRRGIALGTVDSDLRRMVLVLLSVLVAKVVLVAFVTYRHQVELFRTSISAGLFSGVRGPSVSVVGVGKIGGDVGVVVLYSVGCDSISVDVVSGVVSVTGGVISEGIVVGGGSRCGGGSVGGGTGLCWCAVFLINLKGLVR